MISTLAAKYYDGKSSASQETNISFNESTNELFFQNSEAVLLLWQLDDIEFEQYGSLLELRNKKYSGALLKIDDKEFSQKFYNIKKQNKQVDIHTNLLNLGFAKISLIAIFLLGVIVLSYFYILPPIAEKSVALLPESFDNKIGNIFIETFLKKDDIDTTKTKYLQKFASELNLNNKKQLQFTVVKSNEVNAFALPNGQIVVYTAILDKLKSYQELVALLGHEASHVNNRHSTKMLCRNIAGYMIVSLLFSDVNGVMAVIAENAHQLHSLSYSRAFEQEADEEGLKILINNNINPKGMVQLFELLDSESKFSIPKIISSHPLTIERKENMQKIIAKTAFKEIENDKLNSLFKQIQN